MLWPLLKIYFNIPSIKKKFNITASHSEKLTDNLISASHSIGSILLNMYYFLKKSQTALNIGIFYSYSYFLYDSYKIIINKRKESYSYVIHHIAALILLEDVYYDFDRNLLLYLYMLAEVSNLPNYYIYHKLKHTSSYKLRYAQLYQVIWFSFFRVFVYSFYFKDCVENVNHNLTKIILLLIFGMGGIWTFGQFKGVYVLFSNKNLKIKN
tara:strand:- start:1661 stop:2290 length:630 start_codon:yes stop_codon:yes gene_type:complete